MVNRYMLLGAVLSGTIHGAMLLALAGFSLDSAREEREIVVNLGSVALVKEGRKKGESLASLFRQTSDPVAYYKRHKEKEKKKVRKREKNKLEKNIKREKKKVKKKKRITTEKERKLVSALPAKSEKTVSKKEGTDRKVLGKPTPLSSPAPPPPSHITEVTGGKFSGVGGSQKSPSGKGKLLASVGNYRKEYLRLNLGLIRELIRKEVYYPYMARKMGWEGKVLIGVVLTPEGCSEVRLVKSSGFPLLDESALETVKRVCKKFPKPERKVSLQVPILYRLKE